jgi:hypothetical protein
MTVTLPKLPEPAGADTFGADYTRAQLIAAMALAAKEQRERDAAICKTYAIRHAGDSDITKAQAWMMNQCAAAILAQPMPGEPS